MTLLVKDFAVGRFRERHLDRGFVDGSPVNVDAQTVEGNFSPTLSAHV